MRSTKAHRRSARRRYIPPAVLLFLSVACGVLFQIIGSEVAPDGTLIEPFFLIPIGYLFFFVGVIWLVVSVVCGLFRRWRRR